MCVTRVVRHICAHTTIENGHCSKSMKRGGRLCKKLKKKNVDVLDYCDWDSPWGYCLYRIWRRGWACHKCKRPTQRSPRCICGHVVCRRCSCRKSAHHFQDKEGGRWKTSKLTRPSEITTPQEEEEAQSLQRHKEHQMDPEAQACPQEEEAARPSVPT